MVVLYNNEVLGRGTHWPIKALARQCDSVLTYAGVCTHIRELSGKELAAEMVYSFLLPQVHKKSMREKGTKMVFH